MKDGSCPKCQGTELIPAVQIADFIDPGRFLKAGLSVRLAGEEQLVLLMDNTPAKFFELRAWICGNCGYSELYAVKPQELLDTYREGYR